MIDMKILFIRPNPDLCQDNKYHLSFVKKLTGRMNVICPPLSFPMLAAVTPKKHSIKLVDERYQNIDFNDDYDIVGITAMTNEITRAYEIADEFRKKGKKVAIGGCHVSALPYEAEQHADSVVVGEADELWPQLLEDFEKGCLKTFYYKKKPVDLSKISAPDRNVIRGIVIINGVQSSRGCPHHCEYCFVGNSSHGRIYRKRPVRNIVEEIKKIPQKIIVFYDTSLTIDINHTKALCKALKGLNKKFIFLGNIDILNRNEELLKLAKEAGCIQWNIGFESVSQRSLNEVKKDTNKVKNYYDAVKKIHCFGMYVHGFFMFGFDNDTKEVFKDTMDFIRKAEIDSVDFSILTPFPGTPLFDKFEKEERILTKDWSKYTYLKNVVFKPKNFSKEELLFEVKKLYEEYYSFPEIAKRFSRTIKRGFFNFHLFLFIVDNVFTRIYTLRKLNN